LLEHALLHGIDGLDVKTFSEYTPYTILETTLDWYKLKIFFLLIFKNSREVEIRVGKTRLLAGIYSNQLLTLLLTLSFRF